MSGAEEGAVRGSGNVFADIGFPPGEAEELLVRSSLVIALRQAIEARGLSQTQAAALVGADQPTLNKALRGHLSKVSQDRLQRWLTALGLDVVITVAESGGPTGAVRVDLAPAGWRPMDEAPRDGAWILCEVAPSGMSPSGRAVLRWGLWRGIGCSRGECWTDGERHCFEPLRWKPMD